MNIAKFILFRRTPKNLISQKVEMIKELREKRRMSFVSIAKQFFAKPSAIKTLYYSRGGQKGIIKKRTEIVGLTCQECKTNFKSNIIYKCPNCFSGKLTLIET